MIGTLKFVFMAILLGGFVGYIFGLGYCVRMHAASPRIIFSVADSAYYLVTAFAGTMVGLWGGGVSAWMMRRR